MGDEFENNWKKNLMIGKTISHYKILEKLGEGGMGVVYKAQDTKLDRIVALKFLPRNLLCDSEAKARFTHEAKAASALNHTNITTIYEIDEVEGECFICMEYIEGKNLKDRIESAPLKIAEAIGIALQIAEGLQEAHQKGIIHRDIKSANIMQTTRGQVKIMDFGLAKLAGQTRLTKTGATMGTFAYMSPEQAKGEKVDHRADIWSLGVVIYEMVTGQLPFKSKYEQAIVYSIMNEEPEPMTGLRTGVPMDLERIVAKALEKKKEDRYQRIDEMLVDLRRLKRDTDKVLPKTPQKFQFPEDKERKKAQKRLIYGILAAIILIIVLILITQFIKKESPKQILATQKQITFTGKVSALSISPDAKTVAYVSLVSPSESKMFVQDLAGGQPLEVFKEKDIFNLQWSPDGSELLFQAENDSARESYILPRLGGASRKIRLFGAPRWSPDGSRIVSSTLSKKRIWLTNKSTGDTTSISVKGSFFWLLGADWSPAGNLLLFLTEGKKETTIWTIAIDGTKQHKIVEDSVALALYCPRWSSKGDAVYYLRQNGPTIMDLMKVKVDPSTGEVNGAPIILQTSLQVGYLYSLSKDNKHLLYPRELSYSNLWLVSYADKGGTKAVKTKQLTTGTSSFFSPSISPDGKKIAFSIGGPSESNIFVMPIEGGQIQQLTFLNSDNYVPVWSPDGKEIAFGSNQTGALKVWKVNASGGTPLVFNKSELSQTFRLIWAPGSQILYERPGIRNYHFLNPNTEEEKPLVKNDSLFWMSRPRYSPDGKKVAVHWSRSSASGLWVISLEDSSQVLLHTGSHYAVAWSSDGNWVYAWAENPQSPEILMINASSGEVKKFITLPFENTGSIDIYPNGKKIVCTVLETQSDAWLMENFDPEVK